MEYEELVIATFVVMHVYIVFVYFMSKKFTKTVLNMNKNFTKNVLDMQSGWTDSIIKVLNTHKDLVNKDMAVLAREIQELKEKRAAEEV